MTTWKAPTDVASVFIGCQPKKKRRKMSLLRYLPLKSVISEKRNGAHSMSLIARRKAADMKYHCMLSKRTITVKDVRARNWLRTQPLILRVRLYIELSLKSSIKLFNHFPRKNRSLLPACIAKSLQPLLICQRNGTSIIPLLAASIRLFWESWKEFWKIFKKVCKKFWNSVE